MIKYSIPITDEQKIHAWTLVEKTNYGRRGEADGTKTMQYTGLLGEVCFADIMDLPRPVAKDGWDGGIDFVIEGKKIDLKTMGRTVCVTAHFVNNLIASQVRAGQTDIYLFASINTGTGIIEFIGWLPKSRLRPEWIVRKGTPRRRDNGTQFETRADMYEIQNQFFFGFSPYSFATQFSLFA